MASTEQLLKERREREANKKALEERKGDGLSGIFNTGNLFQTIKQAAIDTLQALVKQNNTEA
jgi:hypothetical protein